MVLGLSGMSYASNKPIIDSDHDSIEFIPLDHDDHVESDHDRSICDNIDVELSHTKTLERRLIPSSTMIKSVEVKSSDITSNAISEEEISPKKDTNCAETIEIFNVQVSRRKVGLIAAVCNGVFSGSSFAPMQYLR